jgi:hypothetical protein
MHKIVIPCEVEIIPGGTVLHVEQNHYRLSIMGESIIANYGDDLQQSHKEVLAAIMQGHSRLLNKAGERLLGQ